MKEIASLTALGGVFGDTHSGKEIHQVYADGVYDWIDASGQKIPETRYETLVSGQPINGAFAIVAFNDTIDATALGGSFQPGDRITLQTDIGTLVAYRNAAGTSESHYYGRDQRNTAGNIRTGLRLAGNILQHRGVDSGDGTIQWVTVERLTQGYKAIYAQDLSIVLAGHAATDALTDEYKYLGADGKKYGTKDAIIGWCYDNTLSGTFVIGPKTNLVANWRGGGQTANVWFDTGQSIGLGNAVATDAGFVFGTHIGGHHAQTGSGQAAYARRDGNTGRADAFVSVANQGLVWAVFTAITG